MVIYQYIKFNLIRLGANTLFAYCTIQLTLDSDIRRIMIMCLALFVTGLLCFRCIGALLHYGW